MQQQTAKPQGDVTASLNNLVTQHPELLQDNEHVAVSSVLEKILYHPEGDFILELPLTKTEVALAFCVDSLLNRVGYLEDRLAQLEGIIEDQKAALNKAQ